MTEHAPSSAEKDDFFVGYLGRVPATARAAMLLFVMLFVAAFTVGSLALALTQSDPGDGGFVGGQTLTGVIIAAPYPHLRMAATPEHPNGRTVLLNSARGKRGVQAEAAALNGKMVEVVGGMVRRGAIETLQVGFRGGAHRIAEQPDLAPPFIAPPVDLGRWRIAGEICDGKCYLGVMRPGRGLAHKACANLCLVGGAPAVFVAQGGVEGEDFLLLADQSGAPLPDAVYDLTAVLITLDGQVERHGGLLVFKADLSSAELL